MTGLLLSYRFSSAVNKWEDGKKLWVDVRTSVRDGVRMVRICLRWYRIHPDRVTKQTFDFPHDMLTKSYR